MKLWLTVRILELSFTSSRWLWRASEARCRKEAGTSRSHRVTKWTQDWKPMGESCLSFLCIPSSRDISMNGYTQHNMSTSACPRHVLSKPRLRPFLLPPQNVISFLVTSIHDFSCALLFDDNSSLGDNIIEIVMTLHWSLCFWLCPLLYTASLVIPLKYLKFKDNEIRSKFMPPNYSHLLRKD